MYGFEIIVLIHYVFDDIFGTLAFLKMAFAIECLVLWALIIIMNWYDI